jgi:hypothetical protein
MVRGNQGRSIIMTKSQPQPRLLKGSKPTHRLYRVIGEGESATWTPIGAAWPNKDGKGFSLTCDAVPLQGRLILRLITERPAANGGQQ